MHILRATIVRKRDLK